MPLTNPNKVVTEERLSEFYGQILPYMGGMPDVLANKFSKGDLYSTDEKMIGCWVDNRPLYQKTVATGGNVPSGATLIQRTTQTGYDTILYTKTTDSPISIGDANDYSTDEKIVGTWIDGKPIYQKVYDVGSVKFGTPTWGTGTAIYNDLHDSVDTFLQCWGTRPQVGSYKPCFIPCTCWLTASNISATTISTTEAIKYICFTYTKKTD